MNITVISLVFNLTIIQIFMCIKTSLFLICLLLFLPITAQVGVNTTNVNAMLNVVGKGNTSSTHALRVANDNNKTYLDVRDDSNVGVGTNDPKVRLDLRDDNGDGSIGVGDTPQTPSEAGAGAIKYAPSTEKFYYSMAGNTWEEIVGVQVKAKISASITSTGNMVANNSPIPQALTNWTLIPDESNYMFDVSTGVFTVPRNGLYTVTFSVNFKPGEIAEDSYIEAIWKYSVGTGLDIKSISTYYMASPSGVDMPAGVLCAGNIRMQQGETLTPLIWQNLGVDKELIPVDTNLSIFEN